MKPYALISHSLLRVVAISVISGIATASVAADTPSGITTAAASLAGDIPSVSGDTPYTLVSNEEPVKPTDKAKPTTPTVELRKHKDVKAADDKTLDAAKQFDKSENGKTKADEPKAHKADSDDSALGEPLASSMVQLLHDEILTAVRQRGVTDAFQKFLRYEAYKLDSSTAAYTGSELAGNCRMKWYDHLLRNPLAAPGEAEEFTRRLHTAILKDRGGLAGLLPIIAEKLDLPKRQIRTYATVRSPQEAMDIVKQSLVEAQTAYVAALAPLSKSEIREMVTYLYPVMVGQNFVGHTLQDRNTGRRLVDLMEKMDRNSLINAADALVPLTDPMMLEQLKSYPDAGEVYVPGVSGHVVAKIDTPAGAIILGGKGANTYQLDSMGNVAAVIDLGGGNTYYEGTTSLDRPVLVTINLGGSNHFQAYKPGVQGGAMLGVSMVVNLEGDNLYEAHDMAQGSSLAGVGIVIDFGGRNRYRGVRRVQAQTVGGLGILIGHGGENDYHAGMWAQGFGGPLGFAILDDIAGHDHYYCGGLYPNSYKPETPGYEGCGQGVGAGIRQVANGGIGVLLNGGGHDVYEFDYLCHGGGYWGGLGFARDFGGYNKRLIARKAFDGGPRTEALFQRFGCGWGCHYALGFCFDDKGHSTYEGSIMGSGMGWDCSVGVLCDFGGNSLFDATNSLTQGCGAQNSLGILFQYGDNSVYKGYTQAYASPSITYHHMPECGGNFSFLVNYGDNNTYGCGAQNHTIIQRGASGGFLISRPRHDEVPMAASKPAEKTTAGP